MENFSVKGQALTTQYEYENDELVINGSYTSDKGETQLTGINGTAYRRAEGNGRGEYVGNFTGSPAGDELEYTMSKMSRSNASLVWDAIDGIESRVNASREGGEA